VQNGGEFFPEIVRQIVKSELSSAPVDLAANSPAEKPADVGAQIHADAACEILKLNPNCCHQNCLGCSSWKKLLTFQARHPGDWPVRLRGSARLIKLVNP
jgi:hypothetical protein